MGLPINIQKERDSIADFTTLSLSEQSETSVFNRKSNQQNTSEWEWVSGPTLSGTATEVALSKSLCVDKTVITYKWE